MKITIEILTALQEAVSSMPNRNQFAKKVGVPQHTIARWLEGKSKSISDANYEKLFPYIKPYLKDAEKHQLKYPVNCRSGDDRNTMTALKMIDVYKMTLSGSIPGIGEVPPITKFFLKTLIAICELDIDQDIKNKVIAAIQKIDK